MPEIEYKDPHAEEIQEIMERTPGWMMRWGITLFFGFVVCRSLKFCKTKIRTTEVHRRERQADGLHRRGCRQRHCLPAWESDLILSVAQCDPALRRIGASGRLRPDRRGRVREAVEFRS